MRTEFRKAVLPKELRSLVIFDRKVFRTDAFYREDWVQYESWWLLVDGVKAGCCAFEKNVGIGPDGEMVPTEGSLYVATTGILPRFQGQGLGSLMKSWQLSYARRNGFARVVGTSRESNTAMIALNERFGFRVVSKIEGYYLKPLEAAVVMQWLLNS